MENVIKLNTSRDKEITKKDLIEKLKTIFSALLINFRDHQSKNYLVISSDIESRYKTVITKVSEYFDKSVEKTLENPDVMYVRFPLLINLEILHQRYQIMSYNARIWFTR